MKSKSGEEERESGQRGGRTVGYFRLCGPRSISADMTPDTQRPGGLSPVTMGQFHPGRAGNSKGKMS